MNSASLHLEDTDIVRMTPSQSPNNQGSVAWVNVGAHAVELTVQPNGNLTIQTYPIGNESDESRTGILSVTQEVAVQMGAVQTIEDEA